ncbi:ABC transporter transmembrane domain-containing protein [Oceanibacterium hippocampi]|uniref:Multidrug resistance ABC transporter ATP-binding/permease protein BmrA n=1 Tax=Oceanibacterium hippocampi TaxID=745714 RepID=A0A1Y5TUR4_9PROT|nr:ABC transporter transmembrane domain-containing protein [Oceanibacterium hippocampi]SLN73528.1 Multidrug resistance ABC transporter ATP-binding/permease protein BmrA [Oceanibacterium hippocampi]
MSEKNSNAGAGATDERPKSRDLAKLRRLMIFALPYRGVIAGAGVALVVAAGATLAIPQALRRVIDHGFSGDDGGFVDLYFLALLGVALILAAATVARFYLVTWLGERVIADIRKAVFDHIVTLNPAFFETTRTGEVLSRLTTDTTVIQTVVGSSISIALRNILLLIGGLAMMVVTSPKLAGTVCLVVPFVVVPIVFFGRRVRRLSRDSQDRVADLSARAGEVLGAIQTVQAFTHERFEQSRFGGTVEAAFEAALLRIRARSWLTGIVISLIFGSVVLVLWIGARAVVAGEMSGGVLSAFVLYAVFVAGAVGALSEVWGELQRAAGAAERLLELLAAEPDIRAPEVPAALPSPTAGRIVFDNVTFHYPTRPDVAALNGFSLTVEPGETVALVGPSGAGKTTVFQTLLRFYDPQSGRITLDDVPIDETEPEALRQVFGLVPQEPVMFAATALENIRYGRPEADDRAVRAAADAAAAADFIDAMPEGFQSELGERGVRLSGGQKQRVAIARAVLRNPSVLLLDEATSALDAESERLVQGALDRLREGRTTLVIAHRLATVLKADRIAVIENGRVVALGRHDELMRGGGLYARLAKLQFENGMAGLSGEAAQ